MGHLFVPRRAERRFFALIILVSLLLILQFVVATAISSALGEYPLPYSNQSVEKQCTSASFVALLQSRKSITSLRQQQQPQQQQKYTPTRPATRFHAQQKISSPSSATALGFWTRATTDHSEHHDLTSDEGVKRQGVDVQLVSDGDGGGAEGIAESKICDADANNDAQISLEYGKIPDDGNEDQLLSKHAEAIAVNTTDVATVRNRTNLQSENTTVLISSGNNGTMLPHQSKARSTGSSSKWKEKLLSIPGAMVLPGTPLFMRLMPIKSSEIINTIMHEENPPVLEKHINVQTEVTIYEEIANATKLSQEEGGDQLGNENSRNNSTSHHSMNEPINGSLQTIPLRNTTTSSSEQAANGTNSKGGTKQNIGKTRRRFFFQRKTKPKNETTSSMKRPTVTKEELECPVIATNIHELQSAVLIDKIPLRDVGFRFHIKGAGSDIILGDNSSEFMMNETNVAQGDKVFFRDDPVINGSLSSLLTCDAKSSSDPEALASYQRGIALMNLHPVLSIVRERVKSKSKPGNRQERDSHHLALVIEGGGMRGSVSAGMAAALSTLDLLDAFDSIHGSSAGAIVGAYLVSRQLCTDVYTDIMPAAGSRFASVRPSALFALLSQHQYCSTLVYD